MRMLLLLMLVLMFGGLQSQTCSCGATFNMVYSKWAQVRNMAYHSYKIERKKDEFEEGSFDWVVQRDPFKVAGVMAEKGHRLLYDPSVRLNESLYISKGFPYTNLWLDINGKVFRGLNHYTISNAGCEFIFGIIRSEFERMPDEFICRHVMAQGRKAIEVYAETDNFHFTEYVAKDGETVLDIGAKFKVMAYVILENNPEVDNYLSDCGGLKLRIPSHYGSKVKLVVDEEHGMPLIIEVHDPKGLLEHYEYSDYSFDLKLPTEYFTEDYLDDLD